MKIVLIPIDNRPVCYTLPLDIAAIDPELELILPERKLLGDLKNKADIEGILNWLKEQNNIDAVVVSLDTIAYGGLVSSRRGNENASEILNRINKLKLILSEKKAKVYAFSSIMRISNNNVNEEEKEYWSKYGKMIFEYSFNLHKSEKTRESECANKCKCNELRIPEEILEDYLATRNRNYLVNKEYLEWAGSKIIDTLVYSKDDCAEYGLNVKEAELLQNDINHLGVNALVKTGADEIPLTLLSRAYSDFKHRKVQIYPEFLSPDTTDKISKYEDISVFESVKSQIELAGGVLSDKDEADLTLVVNNFVEQQGEIVMGVFEKGFSKELQLPESPYFIADILNANGGDNLFVENFLLHNPNLSNFYGYSAWNTTGNTLGSGICAAVIKLLSTNPNETAFKKLQFVRFMDDWAYQANVRQELKKEIEKPDIKITKSKMKKYEDRINTFLESDFKEVEYGFPWDRFFEIEVKTT